MEKMTNRPCLDMDKVIELAKGYCQIKGYDEKELIDILKSAFIGWYSRSIATCLFVFCKNDKGSWCVLASERGEEAADYQGYWNCTCGYLDFGETTAACARRECYEETGIALDANNFHFIGYEDDPVTANRQNVTFRFANVIYDKKTSDFKFSHEHNEGKEVGMIRWIPVEDIHSYKWAFNHEKRIDEIFDQLINGSKSYRFWKNFKKKWREFWSPIFYY